MARWGGTVFIGNDYPNAPLFFYMKAGNMAVSGTSSKLKGPIHPNAPNEVEVVATETATAVVLEIKTVEGRQALVRTPGPDFIVGNGTKITVSSL